MKTTFGFCLTGHVFRDIPPTSGLVNFLELLDQNFLQAWRPSVVRLDNESIKYKIHQLPWTQITKSKQSAT